MPGNWETFSILYWIPEIAIAVNEMFKQLERFVSLQETRRLTEKHGEMAKYQILEKWE